MEERLDGLLALLQTQGKVNQQSVPTPEMTPPSMPAACTQMRGLEGALGPHGEFSNPSSQRQDAFNTPLQFPVIPFPKPTVDLAGDVISKGLVSYDLAVDLVQYYRSQVKYFPFVIVSAQDTIDSLRRERPFLLLSMLSVSAIQSSVRLQKTLDLELRESLSRRTIVNGEKSLDLLQGLLVYLVS